MFQHHHFFVSEPVRRLPWLLLALLEPGPANVALLLSQMEQQTDRLYEPGAFYRWLALIERQGWVEQVKGESTQALYCLTEAGVIALNRQRAQRPHTMRVKENLMRFVRWIVRLYPPVWRKRYEEEMQSLLEIHTITPWTLLDLFLNILRAWLNPLYRRSSLHLLRWRISTASALLGLSVGLCLFATIGWIQASDVNVPANLTTLLSGLTSTLLTPLGMVSELLAFASLLLVPLLVLVWRSARRDRKTTPTIALLRLLPTALALVFLCLPRTWIPAWLGVTDWGFNAFLLLTLMDLAGETTALLLSQGKAWLERYGSRLIMAVSGLIMAVCACNAIWTWTAWQLIPWMDATSPGLQWATGLILQLVVMLLAAALAGLALALSLGVSRRLRAQSVQSS